MCLVKVIPTVDTLSNCIQVIPHILNYQGCCLGSQENHRSRKQYLIQFATQILNAEKKARLVRLDH